MQVKEWDAAGAEPSGPTPPDGASFKEIKDAWKYTADTKNMDFNERLPESERAPLRAAETTRRQEVANWDAGHRAPDIAGVYLEHSVPF